MDAWILDESPGSYRLGTIEPPALQRDDVQIRVITSALNHMDLWVTRGMPKPPLPHVPGCDVAGVVEAVGEDVTSVAVGDEVVVNPGVSPVADIVALGNDSPMGAGFAIYGEHTWGGHATYAVAPERNVLRRPSGRTWEECAAYPLATLTAYRMLKRARLAPGHTVLVVGIGSGVSCAALAIARHVGAEVVATSRTEAKRSEALSMGASAVIDSTSDRWNVQADIVVESVGAATWDQSMRSLKPGGRLVVCGGTSGANVTVNLPRLFFKQHEIIGSSMGSYQEFAEVTKLMSAGAGRTGLAVRIDRVFPLGDSADALARLEAGEQLGKIVLQH
jgi:NADPH:quinone reductase-like Zn-dependent oxidoreductase